MAKNSQPLRLSLQSLGTTDVKIPPLGLGTWAWGDRLFWSYGRGYGEEEVRAAYHTALDAGMTFFDTAEVYGSGRSERLIGSLQRPQDPKLVLATKFFPYPWRLSAGQMERALRGSLRRLQVDQVDLYQIHWPWSLRSVEAQARALARVHELELARAVGVSNFDLNLMLRTMKALRQRGVPLASNQVSFSLLDRRAERSGLLPACQDHGVTLIAYSPLAQGLLTGKYRPGETPPGLRGLRTNKQRLRSIQPLLAAMERIGKAHGERTLPQVALNWVMAKGAVPIPGAKNKHQTVDNLGALDWQLDEAAVAELDELSAALS